MFLCFENSIKVTEAMFTWPDNNKDNLFLHSDRDPFNMFFSCSVDGKSSKFQISRIRGKIFCDIPKREDGTVGELVQQNQASVPFHALTVWDYKLHDTRYVRCKHSGK